MRVDRRHHIPFLSEGVRSRIGDSLRATSRHVAPLYRGGRTPSDGPIRKVIHLLFSVSVSAVDLTTAVLENQLISETQNAF